MSGLNLVAGKNRVTFTSSGSKLIGHLYCPDNFDASKQYPAVVAAGPLATVKEQAAGVFAERLAKKGLLALAFDYRRYGESEGEPRCLESPPAKTEDIQNAVSFMRTLACVGSDRVGALGICASSSYIASALMSDKRVKAFATVSAHFSMREFFAENPLLTDELREQLFQASNQARQTYYETGVAQRNDMVWPDMTGKEEDTFSQEIYDYYFKRVSTCWPNFSNHLVPFSFEELSRSHAINDAPYITAPYLGIVGSEAITKPLTERFLAAKKDGEKAMTVIEGSTHIQTYDKDEYVGQAVDALDEFYQKHLAR